jgi:hypothetical protein
VNANVAPCETQSVPDAGRPSSSRSTPAGWLTHNAEVGLSANLGIFYLVGCAGARLAEAEYRISLRFERRIVA